MTRAQGKLVLIIYGLWVSILIALCLYGQYFAGHGEYGISSHIWLILSGLPLSLTSLALPNGSLIGVVTAGILGFIQWAAIVNFFKSRHNGHKP